jgi:hypothetical protein
LSASSRIDGLLVQREDWERCLASDVVASP